MAVPSCHLETLLLPPNDANTCWWLSANLALFHKDRPEMTDYSTWVKDKSFTGSTKSDIFNRELSERFVQISKYYNGSSTTLSMSNLIGHRLGPSMEAVFNTADFKVNKSSLQSSDEYITTLSQYIGLDRGLISINPGGATGALDTYAYDIQLHANHFGIPHIGNAENSSNLTYSQIASDVSTLILTCGRIDTEGKTSIPIPPLKELIVPTFTLSNLVGPNHQEYIELNPSMDKSKNPNLIHYPFKGPIGQYTEPAKFYLDAMVVYEPGHYVTYVKCETSDVWYYYKAIDEGPLGKSFPTFDAMMAADGEKIQRNFTHLVYSKVV
jgi:hypothetical protein